MSAVSTDDSGSSVATAEQDEIFSKHSDERRLGLEMRRYADGPPVTAQKLAHGRAAAGPGQDFIFFFASSVHRNASKLAKLPLTTKVAKDTKIDNGENIECKKSFLRALGVLRGDIHFCFGWALPRQPLCDPISARQFARIFFMRSITSGG